MAGSRDVGAEIRRYLEEAGEIVSLMDLARRWGISKARIHQLTRYEDFPEHVAEVATGTGQPIRLYSLAQAQEFRDKPRKPGPRPMKNES